MEVTKIQLSEEELELACDPFVLLTKNAVMTKAGELLGALSEHMQHELHSHDRSITDAIEAGPKVSRGENYLGLPYVILDFPRYFREHDVFAVRTMFWWGNFFSMTLHLKGNYREHFRSKLTVALPGMTERGFHVCISEDEWEHHFGVDNYIPQASLEEGLWEDLYNVRTFTKLAVKWPVDEWNDVPRKMEEAFAEFRTILGI
jgi:hypothetical protein